MFDLFISMKLAPFIMMEYDMTHLEIVDIVDDDTTDLHIVV
jgi:hypothetical protein